MPVMDGLSATRMIRGVLGITDVPIIAFTAGVSDDQQAAAREAGVIIPVGSLVAQLMASARANGDGGLDHSGLFRGVERLSGRQTN